MDNSSSIRAVAIVLRVSWLGTRCIWGFLQEWMTVKEKLTVVILSAVHLRNTRNWNVITLVSYISLSDGWCTTPKFWHSNSVYFWGEPPTELLQLVFAARRYASAVYAVVVCLSVCLSVCVCVCVCHTPVLYHKWLCYGRATRLSVEILQLQNIPFENLESRTYRVALLAWSYV